MNASLEVALVSYLADALPSAYAELAIRPASNAGEKPVAVPFVILKVEALNRIVGQLYDGALTLMIETPILANGPTVASHSALVKAVEYALNPLVDADHDEDDVAALKEALNDALDAAEFATGGNWTDGPKSSNTADAWFTLIDVKLGLIRL